MRFRRATLDAFASELAPVVVASDELEARVAPALERLRIPAGQLQALTGIRERRWWEEGQPLADAAARAGKKALARAGVPVQDLGALIYAGVCRERFEPATACRVAHFLGLSGKTLVRDISNACLGALNGVIDIANAIELGHIRAGMVVCCESAREINERAIATLLAHPTPANYRETLATFTGGSGAAAIVVTDGSYAPAKPRLEAAVVRAWPEKHELCWWGLADDLDRPIPHLAGSATHVRQAMVTDSVAVLRDGIELGRQTWADLHAELPDWQGSVDRVVGHQVGGPHREAMLRAFRLGPDQDFSIFEHLGNMGSAALPSAVGLAQDRGFLQPGRKVALLGIGSGLNCLMLGVRW